MEFTSRITGLPFDNKFLKLLDSALMTTTKSKITLATFKVRFLSVLAIRKADVILIHIFRLS